MLLLTYGLLIPLLWAVDKAGYTNRLLGFFGRKMRQRLSERDFGHYQPTPHDVIVCTFPKCGTNWTLQIAYQVAMRGQGEYEHIHAVIPWPDEVKAGYSIPLSDDSVRQASPTGLRVIKTHLEWDRVPYAEEARYICVIRDPKDAFVSNYHFLRDVMLGPVMPSVQAWLTLFFSDAAPVSWAHHVNGYWKARHRPNLLLLTFEEMQADLPKTVRFLADFMGVKLTDREFDLVCQKSSFQYMKQINEKFLPGALTPWTSRQAQMIRRGHSGGSSELLSPAQQHYIDRYCKNELKRLASDFPYEDMWGNKRECQDAR